MWWTACLQNWRKISIGTNDNVFSVRCCVYCFLSIFRNGDKRQRTKKFYCEINSILFISTTPCAASPIPFATTKVNRNGVSHPEPSPSRLFTNFHFLLFFMCKVFHAFSRTLCGQLLSLFTLVSYECSQRTSIQSGQNFKMPLLFVWKNVKFKKRKKYFFDSSLKRHRLKCTSHCADVEQSSGAIKKLAGEEKPFGRTDYNYKSLTNEIVMNNAKQSNLVHAKHDGIASLAYRVCHITCAECIIAITLN